MFGTYVFECDVGAQRPTNEERCFLSETVRAFSVLWGRQSFAFSVYIRCLFV